MKLATKILVRGAHMAAAVLLGAGVMAASMTASSVSAAEVRFGYHWTAKHPSAGAAEEFARLATERSGGRLDIETFPSGQLFGVRQAIGSVSSGAVEIGNVIGLVGFGALNRDYLVAMLPGTFKSYAHMRGFFTGTEAGRAILSSVEKKGNLVILAAIPIGPTVITSTRDALPDTDAFKGISARVLTKMERPMWNALGASKTASIPTGEIYTALQTGLIDTLATVPFAITGFGWNEYLKSAQLPYIAFNDAYLIANKTWFDSQPADIRKMLRAVGAEVSQSATEQVMALSAESLARLAKKGFHITTLEGTTLAKRQALLDGSMGKALRKSLSKDVAAALKAYLKN